MNCLSLYIIYAITVANFYGCHIFARHSAKHSLSHLILTETFLREVTPIKYFNFILHFNTSHFPSPIFLFSSYHLWLSIYLTYIPYLLSSSCMKAHEGRLFICFFPPLQYPWWLKQCLAHSSHSINIYRMNKRSRYYYYIYFTVQKTE